MEIISLSSFLILILASFVQTHVVGGNSVSTCGGIFEGDSGEFEYYRENGNADDSTGSSVCIWIIKLLTKDGAGVSLKLEDLDKNSVVNFYSEGEPTDPVNTPNTLNSSQINSAVELSGSIFIITLKSQLDQFENSPTKFLVSWFSLGKLSAADSNFNRSALEVSTCPLDSAISPCTCKVNPPNGAQIVCSGSAVNQSSLEITFRETRRVNEVPEDRGIRMYAFTLRSTELTQLDLAPFYGSKFDLFHFYNNHNLTKLVTSGNPRDHGSIQVNYLYVETSPLSRSGFGDALKYLSNEMTSFYAEDLNQQGDDFYEEDEFLPGLSAHTNLVLLYMMGCNISGRLSFDTWIPKELQNLGVINLEANNISEIGENVFDFEGTDDGLFIGLGENKLNETSFHPNSGINRVGRRTDFVLYDNQIRTLPASIFESFLDAHPQNVLQLSRNPLICDERLSWLKSRREEFESRVFYAKCSNDEGHTVFDSDLIP